jgi:hypothetical protein
MSNTERWLREPEDDEMLCPDCEGYGEIDDPLTDTTINCIRCCQSGCVKKTDVHWTRGGLAGRKEK